jgi:hypothetical protein
MKKQLRARTFNFEQTPQSSHTVLPAPPAEFIPTCKLDVITSCSAEGWTRYGQKCVRSFMDYWPAGIKLHLVSEDNLTQHIAGYDPNRIVFHSLYSYELAAKFYERHKDNKASKGYKRHTFYNFREDAYRFSKKVFAIRLVTLNMIEGRIIWLDADTVTSSPIPLELLYRMPPDDYCLAFLDRPRYHSECGFVGYNLNHQDTKDFIAKFAQLYELDKVFDLREWHDSWVFDWLRHKMQIKGYPISHNNLSHPFVHSELGKYMDHMKGNRKNLGMSVEHPKYKRKKG